MLKKALIAVSALTMATFAAAPAAQADGFYFGFYGNSGGGHSGGHYFSGRGAYHAPHYVAPHRAERVMTRQQIRRHLRQRGFRDFRRINRRGRYYVVVAEARRGQIVRLRVNAYNGRIERRRRIG